jgi:Fe-S-cluster containining protein
MNDVYQNPAYMAEIEQCMDEMKILLSMDPKHSYFIIRNEIQKIVNSDKFQSHIKCGSVSNCSFCCHDKIMMGQIEAEYIKSKIIEKKAIPNKHRVKEQNKSTSVKWIDKACPMLLDENEKGQRLCSIYDDRPLICMTHNSIMEPINCNKEKDPKRNITEAKAAMLDAFSFVSMMLGNGSTVKDPSGSLVAMHEMLAKMDF